MIPIDNLESKDIGRQVEYDDGFLPPEVGYITSWNERFVFVSFDEKGRGKACQQSSLNFTCILSFEFIKSPKIRNEIQTHFTGLCVAGFMTELGRMYNEEPKKYERFFGLYIRQRWNKIGISS